MERLLGITLDLVFSILLLLLGLGSDWGKWCSIALFPFQCFFYGQYLRCLIGCRHIYLQFRPQFWTWINLVFGICFTVPQEGPCSPASISHTIPAPIFDAKWLVHASLMFAMVSSLPLKSTNSLGLKINRYIKSWHWLKYCVGRFGNCCCLLQQKIKNANV